MKSSPAEKENPQAALEAARGFFLVFQVYDKSEHIANRKKLSGVRIYPVWYEP